MIADWNNRSTCASPQDRRSSAISLSCLQTRRTRDELSGGTTANQRPRLPVNTFRFPFRFFDMSKTNSTTTIQWYNARESKRIAIVVMQTDSTFETNINYIFYSLCSLHVRVHSSTLYVDLFRTNSQSSAGRSDIFRTISQSSSGWSDYKTHFLGR